MDPRDFLQQAKTPLENGDPASLRTAISRAHYAAHHVGAGVLEAVDIPVPGDGKRHLHVARWLKRTTDQEVRRAGKQLGTLYEYRGRADYELSSDGAQYPDHPENLACATMRVQEASNMIRWLTGALKDGARLQTIRANLQAAKRRGDS
jgi:uncharacterized protein (UPF0332 family)